MLPEKKIYPKNASKVLSSHRKVITKMNAFNHVGKDGRPLSFRIHCIHSLVSVTRTMRGSIALSRPPQAGLGQCSTY